MTLGVGIIGLGVGERHIPGYRAHPGCEVRVLCDFDREKLAAVGARHPGTQLTESADELIDDPDVDIVSVASYDSFHHQQVVRALERGKHVFVEKPLVQTREHAEEVHALLADRAELRLSSNLPLRRSPRFRWLKEQLGAGSLGRHYYFEGDYEYGRGWKLTEGWRGQIDYYSVTLGGAVHLVDLLLWLTGDRVTRVTAHGNRIATAGTQYRHDDLVVAVLELESGALAKISANFGCVHAHFHGIKLFGTEGTFVNGLENGTLWHRRGREALAEPVTEPYPGMEKGDLIRSFVGAILGEGEPEVSEREVFDTLAVCFAIDAAVASGEAVAPTPFG